MNLEKIKDLDHFKEVFVLNLLSPKPSSLLYKLQEKGYLHTYLPELDDCFYTLQDIKYHKDSVFKHCIKTCDSTPLNLGMELRWAGLLHDIGKPRTVQIWSTCELCGHKELLTDYKRLKENPYYFMMPMCDACLKLEPPTISTTFHKHEVASTVLTKRIMKRFNIEYEIRRQILYLVSNHMYHYTRDWGDKAIKRFIMKTKITLEDLQNPDQFPLFALRKAERMSRGLQPVTKRQRDMETRLRSFLNNNNPINYEEQC
jgi:tRNA nucleotidyltransferase (CCA-adding enzyme)